MVLVNDRRLLEHTLVDLVEEGLCVLDVDVEANTVRCHGEERRNRVKPASDFLAGGTAAVSAGLPRTDLAKETRIQMMPILENLWAGPSSLEMAIRKPFCMIVRAMHDWGRVNRDVVRGT